MFLVAGLLETAVHELGHAGIGLALGMRLRAFIVGPFQWRIREGQWAFQFLPGKILSAGGAASLVPTNPEQPCWREIWMIAAGPLASLLSGCLAWASALLVVGTRYEQCWQLCAWMAIFGLVAFGVNLIPIRPEALYSDGARIYQLLRGGAWADFHRATSIAASTSVTPLRPRDYNIGAIQRAAQSFRRGPQALLLRLLASSYYLDSGKLSEAGESVAEAEAVYNEFPFEIPAGLCMALAFRIAFLRQDAVGAREWWERMEAKKPSHFGADYWLAKSALLWTENRQDEAEEAWKTGDALARKLPEAGDYEFDRHRSALLGQAINSRSLAIVAVE